MFYFQGPGSLESQTRRRLEFKFLWHDAEQLDSLYLRPSLDQALPG